MTRPTAIVFDLDDTLYKERDYVISCFIWLGDYLSERHSVSDGARRLRTLYDDGAHDPIGALCRDAGVADNDRDAAIQKMRAHTPEISLSPDAARLITHLRQHKSAFSIVTNGRSLTQRCKIAALNLEDAASIAISEETGFAKPAKESYGLALKAHGAAHYIYIGDNPKHDFLGANQLGWTTALLKGDHRNIHPQDITIEKAYAADHEISDLMQVLDLATV